MYISLSNFKFQGCTKKVHVNEGGMKGEKRRAH
nr:MAG TPA_asm: hypothetical protein [Caudoviricetes sp.]